MGTLHDEYETALAAARTRRAVEAIERSARLALRICGWDANRETLSVHVESLPKRRRAEVLTRAIELQREAGDPGRHLTPQEIEAWMTNSKIPKETRDAIKAYCVERRAKDPKALSSDVLREVRKRFGVEMKLAAFQVTYFSPANPTRRRPRQPAQPASSAPAPAPANAPTAAPAAGPSGNGVTPDERAALTAAVQKFNDRATEAIRRLEERTDPVKLGPITVIGVRNGTLRVAIDYEGPAPTVYALVAAASTVLAEREAAA